MENLLGKHSISAKNILESFLTSTQDAFLILDKHGKVLLANNSFHQLYKNITGFLLKHKEHYTYLLQENSLSFLIDFIEEIFYKKKSAKSAQKIFINNLYEDWYDVNGYLIFTDEGEVEYLAISLSLANERFKFYDNLKKSENFYKALVHHSNESFQLTDADLKILYVSDSVKKVIGYDAEELKGNYFFDYVHPDDKIIISTWLYWLINNEGKLRTDEIRIKNKNAQWVYIELNGNNLLHIPEVQAIVVSYRDIQAKKTAENALQLAEQRMSLLLNNTKESFIVLNSRLRVITYNYAAQEKSPYFFSQELQSGVSILELIAKTEVADMIEVFEKVFEGEEAERETIFSNKGEEFYFHHSFRPLLHEKEIVGVFMTTTDVTEKRKAQQSLSHSEERNRIIIQESFDAMLIKNAENEIVEASDAVENILGYTPKQLIGNKCFDFLHPDYKEKTATAIERINEKYGNEETIELQILNSKNQYVWVEMKGKNMFSHPLIKGMIVTLRDIAERKKAEQEILFSEQRFKGLVQKGIDVITIVNNEGIIQYLSPTVKNVLGNNPEDFIGRSVFEYVHDVDKIKLKIEFRKMLENKEQQITLSPFRHKNAAYEYVWLEGVVTNMTDDPAIKGIVINTRDITERIKLQEQQQNLTQELIKNNHDLQQFSFITSHNLRAPVANLIGLMNLYNKENIDDPFNQTLIEKFEEATQQLNNTLNDLLEVLVLKSNKTTATEFLKLQQTCDIVYKNLESTIKETNTEISTNFSSVEKVFYNRLHLESIFQNLISNAIKYRSPKRNPIIQIKSFREKNWVLIEFTDNGIGIDMERYKDRIFGLYQRFHSEKDGKGLGLYMLKAQVSSMGGKIEVESKVDVGTTFKVYILHYD